MPASSFLPCIGRDRPSSLAQPTSLHAVNDPTVRFGVDTAGARPLPSTRLSTFGPRYEPGGGGGGSLVSARKWNRIARSCDAHRCTHTMADECRAILFSCVRVC